MPETKPKIDKITDIKIKIIALMVSKAIGLSFEQNLFIKMMLQA